MYEFGVRIVVHVREPYYHVAIVMDASVAVPFHIGRSPILSIVIAIPVVELMCFDGALQIR